LRNVVRIITETGLRVYKELMPMKKEQVDLGNGVAWIPDSKTPYGMAEVPTTQVLFGKRHFNESGVVRPDWTPRHKFRWDSCPTETWPYKLPPSPGMPRVQPAAFERFYAGFRAMAAWRNQIGHRDLFKAVGMRYRGS
jgi:hypothetical protein